MTRQGFAPFIHTANTTSYIYANMFIAMLPCAVMSVYNYGLRAIILMAVCMMLYTASDIICAKVMTRGRVFDVTSLTGGMLFVLLLPPDIPLVRAVVGVFLSSIIFKQFFGGVGGSVVLPSIAGRLAMEIIWRDNEIFFAVPGTDMTMLPSLVSSSVSDNISYPVTDSYYMLEVLAGKVPVFMGTGCAILALAGFVFLKIKRTHRLTVSAVFLLITCAGVMLIYFFEGGLRNGIIYLLSSGVIFIASFILSDPETMPHDPKAAVLCGVIAGAVYIIAYLSGYPTACLLLPGVAAGIFAQPLDYLMRNNIASGEET